MIALLEECTVPASFQAHPLAVLLIPELDAAQYLDLKADIARKGCLHPIKIWENQILDGRGRYRACRELGIDPPFEEFVSTDFGPIDYLVSVNLRRRHMTQGQRAAMALKLKDNILWKRNGPHGDGNSRARVAAILQVGTAAIARANSVRNKDPELFAQVAAGKIGVHTAWKQVRTPQVEQIFKTSDEASAAVGGFSKRGMTWEGRCVNGRWISHFFGKGITPYTPQQWSQAATWPSFGVSIDKATREIEHLDYE